MKSLNTYAKDVYSQSGEDGIIIEILKRLSINHSLNKFCVEFGAWDGVYASNTCNLIKNQGYNALLIESNPKRILELNKNHPNSNIIKLCAFVDFEGENTLDKILTRIKAPIDLDFLSIDIDGADYWILDSLKLFRPKLICIEYNPEIPIEISYINPRNFSQKHGSSSKALSALAKEKNYCLVAGTANNLLFLRSDLIDPQVLVESSLMDVAPNRNFPTFIFAGYDGSILSNKNLLNFPWHNLTRNMDDLNVIPKFIRKFPGDWSYWQKKFYALYLRYLKITTKIRHLSVIASKSFWQ